MGDQEQEDFKKSMALATRALRAAGEREDRARRRRMAAADGIDFDEDKLKPIGLRTRRR